MRHAIRNDTIAAIATPPGEGAIAIVRVSGPGAFAAVQSIFQPSSGRPLDFADPRPRHGVIAGANGPIDEVLVLAMGNPRSYTGEDTVEIHGHGSTAAATAILEAVTREGARVAEPGEFTKRAFLNGRIDLVQAEAVIDRIQAQTGAALRAAHAAASGALSKTIHEMRDSIANALARVEAAIDFPDEDLPELVDETMRSGLQDVFNSATALLQTAHAGRRYREGAHVAIVGRPNVGKSSLFNALVRDARAIVTPHAGTTRDRIDEVINIGGIPVRVSDTAGVRDAADQVEQIGVERSRDTLRSADAIVLVLDIAAPFTREDETLANDVFTGTAPVITVLNKCDLNPSGQAPDWCGNAVAILQTSAVTNEGVPELEETLTKTLAGPNAPEPGQALITRAHQQDSLRRATEAVQNALENFNASPEFLALDLRAALDALGEITGETTDEDILDKIFGEFCLGK